MTDIAQGHYGHYGDQPTTGAAEDPEAARVRRLIREELASWSKQQQTIGWVTALAPLTVRLLTGGDVLISTKNASVELTIGNRVSLTNTGAGYMVTGLAGGPDDPVAPDTHSHFTNSGRFYRNANQTIINNTEVQVTLTSTQGTSTVGSISAGGVALSTSGLFIIGADTAWDASGTGFRWIDIRADGVALVNNTGATAGASIATVQGCVAFVERTAGEVITVHVRHTHGSDLALQGSTYTGRLATRLWIILVNEV